MKRRDALDELDEVAREHPEAFGGRGVKEWEGILSDSCQVAFRLPSALMSRIDAVAARMREESPGIAFTRSDVIRLFLARAVAAEDAGNAP